MTRRRARRPVQLVFARHAGWGGKRKNAGRPPKGKQAGVSHARRPALAARFPVHVTLKVLPHVWNLRDRVGFRVVGAAIGASRGRGGLRVCAFSVQGDHVHLCVEAADARALSRGMQGLSIRIARGLNAAMGRKGRVLADRFHSRILRSPTEIARVLTYQRENYRQHARSWGQILPPAWRDPCCSATPGHGVDLAAPRTYLLCRALE